MDAVIARPAHEPMAVERDGTLGLAVLLVLAVIGFEQFLHTSPAAQTGSPTYEVLYWLSDALLALPFALLAVWGGGWIADRWGLGLFGYAGAIALLFGIALIPGWFLHDDVDRWAHTVAQTGGHSHGGHGGGASHDDEVHWAGDTVFRLLILVPLGAAAVWGGGLIGRRLSRGRADGRRLVVRAGAIGMLLVVALVSAWFLEIGADRADPAGQVTYKNAYVPGHIRKLPTHSHGGAHIHLAAVSVAAVSPEAPLGYRLSHAFRDGLSGQAVGLPLLVLALLWRRRTPLGSRPRWANS